MSLTFRGRHLPGCARGCMLGAGHVREGKVRWSPAGELSDATGLSTGAVTTMLDRLERAGYVRPERDLGDRRRVLVEPTELAGKYATAVYAPLAAQAEPLYGRFTEQELHTIVEFLRTVNEFHGSQITRVEALGRGSE